MHARGYQKKGIHLVMTDLISGDDEDYDFDADHGDFYEELYDCFGGGGVESKHSPQT